LALSQILKFVAFFKIVNGNNVGDAAAVEGDDVVAADEAGCARNENAHRVKISEKEY
jgi:hypothetical protein